MTRDDTSRPDPDIRQVGEIQLDENHEFQEREWRVQRIGWAVMALIVLAALLGLFGRGLLAEADVGAEGDPVRLRYDRFTRHSSETLLKIRLAPGVSDAGGRARVWLDRRYIQDVTIENITPEPESMEVGESGIVYVFRVAEPDRPTRVIFHIQPDRFWLRSGSIGLAGREPLRFRQFVFP